MFFEACFEGDFLSVWRVLWGMPVSAVTFDLWNTLVYNRNYGEFRVPALKRMLTERGCVFNEGAVEEAYLGGFRYSSRIIREEGRRHVETGEIVGEVLGILGVRDEALTRELVKMYEEAFLCDPPGLKEGVFKALEYAKRFKVGLVSVTGVSPGRLVRGALRDHGILGYFDSLSFSDEVKYVKPNVKLYRHALEALNVEPEETVHVGDSLKGDVVGAIDAGMRVIWVKTGEDEIKPGYEPDGVIGSLFELQDALRALE